MLDENTFRVQLNEKHSQLDANQSDLLIYSNLFSHLLNRNRSEVYEQNTFKKCFFIMNSNEWKTDRHPAD